MATGVSIPLRGLEGIPGLPGASQDEAVRTRKFEMSYGGGATCRSTLISRSTLEKNPLHGHLFEGNPVDEGTKRRGLTPSCIIGKARKFHIQIDKWLVTP